MADQIRTAVVGTGYFGRFHANHYTKNPNADLVAVVDADSDRAKAMAEEFGAEALTAVSYTHLTLPTTWSRCRSRWSPYH